MTTNRTTAFAAIVAIMALSLIGLIAGSPNVFDVSTFGDVLRAFASDTKTKGIFAMILVDVVTGVIAAMRVGVFDPQRLATFYASNVVPFVFGYMLYWIVALFGVGEFLPPPIGEGIAAIGYGVIMTTLIGSTVDNLRRARDGSTPPETVAMSNVPPADAQG